MELIEESAIDEALVRRQLVRMGRHPLFVGSSRIRRFLEFTIESVFSGRRAELKEYVLGVEVFDRGTTYNPRTDPIVRVEARRLRSKLRAYYQAEGARDDVIIEYPSGSYVPRFRLRDAASDHREPSLIAVLPFASASEDECAQFAEGLTREVIHELVRCVDAVRVFSGQSRGNPRARIEALLTGTVRRCGPRLRVTAELLSTGSTQSLWSVAFESVTSDPLTAQKQIAFATAHGLSLHFHRRAVA
ncbi:MAG: hypothetical protein LAP40_13205 [Acidobacteriia bacterium]|nr:hypothetical protein [Terriglobia bacterium]